jgi:hypothetical protein
LPAVRGEQQIACARQRDNDEQPKSLPQHGPIMR